MSPLPACFPARHCAQRSTCTPHASRKRSACNTLALLTLSLSFFLCPARTTIADDNAADTQQLPASWPEGARAQPLAFESFQLPPSTAFQQLAWPKRVQPINHPTPWFHAVQTIQSDIPFAAPSQFFAAAGDEPVLQVRAKRDAERLATALGIADADFASKLPRVISQGEGAFLVTINTPDKDIKLAPANRRYASMALRLVSAREQPSEQPNDQQPNAWLIEHAAFFVYDPIAKRGADASTPKPPPQGVILLLPGLLATPEGTLDGLARKLRRSNWVVLRLISLPSRFIEQTPMIIDENGPDQSVQAVARVLDERMVDCAYAVAGAFAELEKQRPALAALPRITIGFSGGAIASPTVMSLDAPRYAGAVLVGAGSNFFQMIDTSNYTSFLGGTGPTWPDLAPMALEAFKLQTYTAYLKHATFDPFNTALTLQDKPTLMIYGSSDKAVPAPLADQLWSRLGSKQREVYDVGHEVLFAQLPSRFDAIVAWCNAVAQGKDPATIPQAAGFVQPEAALPEPSPAASPK